MNSRKKGKGGKGKKEGRKKERKEKKKGRKKGKEREKTKEKRSCSSQQENTDDSSHSSIRLSSGAKTSTMTSTQSIEEKCPRQGFPRYGSALHIHLPTSVTTPTLLHHPTTYSPSSATTSRTAFYSLNIHHPRLHQLQISLPPRTGNQRPHQPPWHQCTCHPGTVSHTQHTTERTAGVHSPEASPTRRPPWTHVGTG
jgi:hypothetical protein